MVIKFKLRGGFLIAEKDNGGTDRYIRAITNFTFNNNRTVLNLIEPQGALNVTHSYNVSDIVDEDGNPFENGADGIEDFLDNSLGVLASGNDNGGGEIENLDELFVAEKDSNGNVIKTVSLYDLRVPSESIEIGDSIKMSDLAQAIGYSTKYNGKKYLIVDYEFNEDGSERPIIKQLSEPSSFTLQPVSSATRVFSGEASFNILSQQDVIGELYNLKIHSENDIRLRVYRLAEDGGEKTLLVDEVIKQSLLNIEGSPLVLSPVVDFETNKIYELNFASDSDMTIKGVELESGTYTPFGVGVMNELTFVPFVERTKGWEYVNKEVAYLDDLQNDFGDLNSFEKADLSLPSQPTYGISVKARARGGNLLNGQPVIWNYYNNHAYAVTAGALPSQHDVLGICLEDIADGEVGRILEYGFCTARRQSILMDDSDEVVLDSNSNGNVRALTNSTRFLDSGGADNNYDDDENYFITFDAGDGKKVDVTVNEFNFEITSSSMYDRMGLQVSDDGINYSNVNVSWMLQSDDDTPPYDRGVASESNGYVFPENSNGLVGEVINTNSRYVRFYFKSDTTINDTGWDFTLSPDTPYTSSDKPLPEGSSLYLKNEYPSSRLSEDSKSNILYGFSVSQDASNDSVLMRIYKPKPTA